MTYQVFYVPGQPWAQSYATQRADGEWVSQTGKTLAEMASEHPGVTLCTEESALDQIEARTKRPPVLIDAERFMEALECLPPVNWVREGSAQSFKMSERINGRVTSIYVRLGSEYFEFADLITTPHREAVRICYEAAPALRAAAESAE